MKRYVFILLSLIPGFVSAQNVQTSFTEQPIKESKGEGFQTELVGSNEVVRGALTKYLREFGKVKETGGYITVTNPVIGGNPYPRYFLYATTDGDPSKAKAWIGKISSEWSGVDSLMLTAGLREMVYQFGVKFYRDQIQLQIDETQQAIDATERRLQKLLAEGNDLTGKLSANEQDKIRLEKALQQNSSDHEILLKKIDLNKKAQDSVSNATGQIRKVLDAQKERQLKVN